MKIFKKSVWVMLTVFFTIMLGVAIIGGQIANQNQAAINGILGINPYKKVDVDGDNQDTEYFKSDFYDSNGKFDDKAMRENSQKLALKTAVEGSVLLWNDNNALPLAKDSKVNLFGRAANRYRSWAIQYDYLLQGQGSGMMYGKNGILPVGETLSNALKAKGLVINDALRNHYETYGNRNEVKRNSDFSYSFAVNEVPWSSIQPTVNSSVDGGAAIMVVSRDAGEYKDILVGSQYVTNNHLDNYNYLDLTVEEAGVLAGLQNLKGQGKISSIVLLINSANPMQFKHIRNNYDIDACVFVGMGGTMSFVQVAELLTAQNPEYIMSGHLTDTFVYSAMSAPAFENYGNFTFTEYSNNLPDLELENKAENNTHNTKYVVYKEGIYVGYRYYETRYEDSVTGNGNAKSTKGVKAGSGEWSYNDEVAFPFGYGLSYANFQYSSYSVEEKADSYDVSLNIKNISTKYSGKETLQVYLQKPYTEYDKKYGIEKSAIELVGIAKTGVLAPGASESLKVSVPKDSFRTYDAYNNRTYILEKGDYYISVGTNAHDALNNVLAKKGYSMADGMDAKGNAAFAHRVTVAKDDFNIYSVSKQTGATISNQFDNADINLYEGTSDQKITYLSRNNWDETYPVGNVLLKAINDLFVRDMQYGVDITANPNDKMPSYGKSNGLTLAMFKDIDFNDPIWEDLLDQMTVAEQQWLVSYGLKYFAGVASVAAPGGLAHDGPVGLKADNPTLGTQMLFPSPVNMAQTWNLELVEELGDAFGMEILQAGYTVIYAPGANIHRTAYAGRNWEYFSEDSFLSGKMLSAEVIGLQSRGVIVITKHFALNDQESNRYGVTTWANEQSIRELYLSPFEIAITEGKMNGVMSSFNRIGTTWAGAHKGLLTNVLRNEWNFMGIVESDACAGGVAHMTSKNAKAAGILAGNDMWMDSGSEVYFKDYTNNATVMQALRQASKRILYGQLNSNAMNGISSTTKIVKVQTWWQNLLVTAQVGVGVVTGLVLTMAVLSFLFGTKWFKQKQEARALAHRGRSYKDDSVSSKYKKLFFIILSVSIVVIIGLTAALVTLIVQSDAKTPLPNDNVDIIWGADKPAYEFEAEDALRMAGTKDPVKEVSERGTTYIGGLNDNKGAKLVFYINAEETTSAALVVTVNSRPIETVFTELVMVEVNGNKLTSSRTVKATADGNEAWTTFVDVNIGRVELQAGENIIQFTTLTSFGYNIDKIKLLSDVSLNQTKSLQEYQFQASMYAVPTPGSSGTPKKENNGFVGNLSGNRKASLTFVINAEDEGTVSFSAAVTGRRQGARKFTTGFNVTINGVEFESDAIVPIGEQSTEWTKSYLVNLGSINLVKGENVIVFTIPDKADDQTTSNFDNIVFSGMIGLTCSSIWG